MSFTLRFFAFYTLIACSCFTLKAQTAFKSGERVSYDVYYNLAFIWVDAADVSFSVSDTIINHKALFNFKSIGNSKPNYDWIFKVRDRFEALVDPLGLKPLLYHRRTSEGSSFANNYYVFNHKKKQIYSSIYNTHGTYKDTLSNLVDARDVLSSVYVLRAMPLNQYSVNDTIKITSVMDNQIISLDIVYCGKENVKHKNGQLYYSHKLITNGIEGTIFRQDSKIQVWVSADDNKIPIKIESEILVGTVQAYLKTVEQPVQKHSRIIQSFVID